MSASESSSRLRPSESGAAHDSTSAADSDPVPQSAAASISVDGGSLLTGAGGTPAPQYADWFAFDVAQPLFMRIGPGSLGYKSQEYRLRVTAGLPEAPWHRQRFKFFELIGDGLGIVGRDLDSPASPEASAVWLSKYRTSGSPTSDQVAHAASVLAEFEAVRRRSLARIVDRIRVIRATREAVGSRSAILVTGEHVIVCDDRAVEPLARIRERLELVRTKRTAALDEVLR